MLYILLAIFACSVLACWPGAFQGTIGRRSYTHARQLDVRAMVAEDCLSQALEQPPAVNGSGQPVGTAAGQCPSGQGRHKPCSKAGLQGVADVRSVSRGPALMVAWWPAPSLPIWVCCCRATARCADVALSGYPGRDLARAGQGCDQ